MGSGQRGVRCCLVADLSQADADALIAMEKHRADDMARDFPFMGGSLAVSLLSTDGVEQFVLDINRKSRILATKISYLTRARQSILLARLDIDGPPHRNPDGAEIPCPHLHLFREGFGLRWAAPASIADFPDMSDLFVTCHDFMKFCNVTVLPILNLRLSI
jgi:hypothetical protein